MTDLIQQKNSVLFEITTLTWPIFIYTGHKIQAHTGTQVALSKFKLTRGITVLRSPGGAKVSTLNKASFLTLRVLRRQ